MKYLTRISQTEVIFFYYYYFKQNQCFPVLALQSILSCLTSQPKQKFPTSSRFKT